MVHEITYWRSNTASSSFTRLVQCRRGIERGRRGRIWSHNYRISDNAYTQRSRIKIFSYTLNSVFLTENCLMVLSQFTAIFKYYRQATQHVSVCRKRSEKHTQCNAKAIHVLLPAHRPRIPQSHSIIRKLTSPNLYLINCFLI